MKNLQTIKLCVFDMAGTTVDEDNLVYKTVQQAIKSIGVEVDLNTCLTLGAGKEKKQAIGDILSTQIDNTSELEEKTAQAFTLFKRLLADAYTDETIKPFDNITVFFTKLKQNNIKIVLNTGYDSHTAHKILAILGWQIGSTIDDLITADDVKNGRPSKEMILLAMNRMGISDNQQVLKAGDSGIDIEEGKNANCGLTVGVLSGAQNREQLAAHQPDIILEKLTDLLSWV